MSARYRWEVASRVLAASLGAYVLTALLSAVLALMLPWLSDASRADGVLVASLLSFAVYTALVIWIFSGQRLRTVWTVLTASSLTLYALLRVADAVLPCGILISCLQQP